MQLLKQIDMKKYLLTILALGTTMMMACSPDNTGGSNEEVKADYTLTTNITKACYDNYGDSHEVNLNFHSIELSAIEVDEESNTAVAKMFMIEYLTTLDNTDGVGTFSPADSDWANYNNLKANTYFIGVEDEYGSLGAKYMEFDMAVMEYTVVELIIDGTLNITTNGDKRTIKGLLKTKSGKTLKIDYTGTFVPNKIS